MEAHRGTTSPISGDNSRGSSVRIVRMLKTLLNVIILVIPSCQKYMSLMKYQCPIKHYMMFYTSIPFFIQITTAVAAAPSLRPTMFDRSVGCPTSSQPASQSFHTSPDSKAFKLSHGICNRDHLALLFCCCFINNKRKMNDKDDIGATYLETKSNQDTRAHLSSGQRQCDRHTQWRQKLNNFTDDIEFKNA